MTITIICRNGAQKILGTSSLVTETAKFLPRGMVDNRHEFAAIDENSGIDTQKQAVIHESILIWQIFLQNSCRM